MKPSEILREAARIAYEVPATDLVWRCGCGAVLEAAQDEKGATEKAAMDFFGLMRDPNSEARIWFGSYDISNVESRDHRVMALCMAAAIAKAEGQ